LIRWNRFLTAYDFDFVGDLLGSDFELIVVPLDVMQPFVDYYSVAHVEIPLDVMEPFVDYF
jgi:hypothetical protein